MSIASLATQQALAGAVARQLYGFRPSAVVRLASENNFVFRAEFGGLPPKVIKLPGRVANLLREQELLRLLRSPRRGLPVPAVEFVQSDLPEAWELDGARFPRPEAVTVMRYAPGMTLADAVLRGEPWAGEAMRAAGTFAARLAEVPPTLLPSARRTQSYDQVQRSMRWVQPVVERFSLTCIAPHLQRVAQIKRRPAASLVHGELYLSNLLGQPDDGGLRLTVVDWETARPGFPLADLAGLVTSLAELPTTDAGQLAYLRRRAMEGFAASHPLEGEAAVELTAWEVFALVSGARHQLDAGRHDRAEHLARRAAMVADS